MSEMPLRWWRATHDRPRLAVKDTLAPAFGRPNICRESTRARTSGRETSQRDLERS
jgi:hypothetical protein